MTPHFLVVMGTRPEAIKLSPIIDILKRRESAGQLIVHVCLTGQHRQMLDQALESLEIQKDFDLDIMSPDQTLNGVAARTFQRLEPVLQSERPDWVLIQGDTTTAAATAIAAHYMGIRVAHVEAGLRTHDPLRPFPEETNRRLVAAVADAHFAPTQLSKENLLREGIPLNHITVTGNTIVDVLGKITRRLDIPGEDTWTSPKVQTILTDSNESRLIFLTAHRRENFGHPLTDICLAVRDVAESHRGMVKFVFPIHPNPNVRATVLGILNNVPNVYLLDPLDYLDTIRIVRKSYLLLTDSGGLQEEGPTLGIPVLVMRDVTERPEGVEVGAAIMVGTQRECIVRELGRLLDRPAERDAMSRIQNPYGDGKASDRIVSTLLGEPCSPFRYDKASHPCNTP